MSGFYQVLGKRTDLNNRAAEYLNRLHARWAEMSPTERLLAKAEAMMIREIMDGEPVCPSD